ncbi:hypothetical protein PCANC_04914 [Puccinia coronata f. sp. avenae]|uniref:Septation initiation network scaffold protein cdc11 n=1 Tax=Puccinia coronata f. sp. avenae TaxID=200324 RepID=A0A2N5VF91_9BASI|nr:hypothetical protein PCASD_03401 [Puccinia coronata f. sp. avenae]PLW54334.1 hypothetical protein PCANC_04914 [Puccinia coronata f. sp. avenae]
MDKPIWLTDELSQEWINLSSSSGKQQPAKHASLRVPSQSRIPVSKRYSSASSFASLLQQNQSTSADSIQRPRIPSLIPKHDNPQSTESAPSSSPKIASDNSIVVNSPQQSEETTPPWLRAAVDGMVNEVLGKRPTQLQKIFQPDQPTQLISSKSIAQTNIQASDPDQPRSDPKSSTSRDTVPPDNQNRPRRVSNESIQSMSFNESSPLILTAPFQFSVSRSSSSSHHQDLQSNPSFQSIIDHLERECQEEAGQEYEGQEQEGQEDEEDQAGEQGELEQEPLYDQLPMLIPPGCNMERLRFVRDERLNEIIEETEPSSSIQPGWKNTSSQASLNSASYLGSSKPPSLPFAHRTPVFDAQHRLHRVNSESSHEQKLETGLPECSSAPSENQSLDNSDLSAGPGRFRFTYDTFTRKHLSRLTEEIKGLSINSACPPKGDALLKIKSILGSPGEEVTDSSTSIGLAHSTPPAIVFSSATNKQRTFQAGRTPYRPLTSHSQRWKEEKEWAESFVEPSSYAVASISPVDRRKSYQGRRAPLPECETSGSLKDSVNSVGEVGRQSCRSSKRIRLESAQSSFETRHRHLRDSVTLMNERNSKRRPATFTRAHPMVVFKNSVSASAASGTPREKSRAPPVSVRDRLAEAKALMDRIRAKTNGGQEVEPTDPPNLSKKPSRELFSSQHITRASNPPSAQNHDLEASESSSALADQQQPAETRDYWKTTHRDSSGKPSRHIKRDQAHDGGEHPTRQHHQVNHGSRKNTETDLNWDISIEEGTLDDRDVEEDEGQDQGTQEEATNETQGNLEDTFNHKNPLGSSDRLDSVHRRLATTAAAFLRQTLGDSNGNHQSGAEKPPQRYGSSNALTSSNLGSTTASRRQFTTQPIPREAIGRVAHDLRDNFAKSNRFSSASTAACTTTSAPTPALTTGTTTRQSSAGSHSHHQGFDDDPRHPHHQKLGLMTIAPGDVEQLLQNARVGKMVFDSAIGKWVKVRSQSETGGFNGKTAEEERQNLNIPGHVDSEDEDSSEEDDIFKDIESLNSKRGSDSSTSRLMSGGFNDTTQAAEVSASINDQEEARNEAFKNEVEGHQAIARNPDSRKRMSIGRSQKFKPKSVLKTGGESPNKSNASMASSSLDDLNVVSGILKPSRSVSFQDGRKNGKIIGLVEGHEGCDEHSEEERTIKDDYPQQRREIAKEEPSRKIKKPIQGEEKENRRNREGSSHSENEDDNTTLHQTSKILINSIKKKVRRKSSLSSTTTASQSNSSIHTPQRKPSRNNSIHNTNLSMTTTTNSNNLIEDYSFELNYSKLIKIITDFEPFEPFWNSIKVINLASKSIDSVIRLNEILPALDQIDLNSNQLNYLSGLPSSLRMLIAYKNQINELCCFSHLQNLEKLDLSQNSLTTLEQLSCLKHLRELKVDDNLISDVSGLYSVDSLIKLSMKGNRTKKLNFELAQWNHLEVLNLDRNQISEVTGLHHLKSVYLLNLDRNQLYSLTIEEPMPKLRVLRVNENRLESLEVSKLVNLRTLYIDNNDLMEISGATRLRKLENLSVRDQRGGELSLTLKQVRDVKRIYLGGNPLPAAFPTCQFYNLLYLELAMCQCQSLPADLANLIPNIRTLNLNYNFLKDLSPLKNLRRLERLTIVGSRVKSLDRGLLGVLESLPELELLDLRQNPLCSSFYPPLLLSSTPSSAVAGGSTARDVNPSDVAPHLNQYQIVTKDQSDDWHSMDDRFRKSLPNEFYLKRMTYRAIILNTCDNRPGENAQQEKQDGHHKLKWLDGIKITDLERRKMEKFLRGISRKLDPNREHQNNSQSVDLLGGSQSSRHLLAKNAHDPSIKNPPVAATRKPDQSISSTAPHRSRHHAQEDSNSIGVIERSRY